MSHPGPVIIVITNATSKNYTLKRDKMTSDLGVRQPTLWCTVWQHAFEWWIHRCLATSFSGGRSRSTRWEPPTMGKQLVNFLTCDCESSAPFFVIYKTDAVLVIGLFELLGNPTTKLIEPPGSCYPRNN